MGNVNVQFTFKHHSGKLTFSSLEEVHSSDIKQELFTRLNDLDQRLKVAAIEYLLEKRIGREQAKTIKIRFNKYEKESPNL